MNSEDDSLSGRSKTAESSASSSTPPAQPDYVGDAHARVADIGVGKRWYDVPYKAIRSLYRSRLGKRLPQSARLQLIRAINYLLVFNQHDINKAWNREDPFRNVIVPNDDHVRMPGIWVVELFPPSEFPTLTASIERNSWDKQRVWIGTGEANLDMLTRSRTGSGWSWWNLAQVTSPDAPYLFPDGLRKDLPPEFQAIELRAVQIGTGLTAVLAYFHLSNIGASKVDEVWHADHEPRILRGKGSPKAESRQFAAYRRTQETRRSLHDVARGWLARNCPGVFVRNKEPQPSLDVLLLEKYDPATLKADPQLLNALRALGITEHNVSRRTSPELPGLLLEPPSAEKMLTPGMGGQPIWALWGQTNAVTKHLHQELSGYGEVTHSLANIVNARIRSFLVLVAISELLRIMTKKLAMLRDDARSRHGRFNAKDLNQLRSTFLTLSVDTASIRRDLDAFSLHANDYEGGAEFESNYAPHILKSYEDNRRAPPDSINMNRRFKEQQIKGFAELVAADRDYREILSTVASLGASVSASRLGRAALAIAIGTFAVAVAALLITRIDSHAPLAAFGRWLWWLVSK